MTELTLKRGSVDRDAVKLVVAALKPDDSKGKGGHSSDHPVFDVSNVNGNCCSDFFGPKDSHIAVVSNLGPEFDVQIKVNKDDKEVVLFIDKRGKGLVS